MAAGSQDSHYFSRIELLVPIKDKIENRADEGKKEAIRMHHVSTEGPEPSRSNPHVGQPWFCGDSKRLVRL